MAKNRIYQSQNLAENQSIQLDQRASHHLLKVLRMRTDDSITLFNGDGNDYSAQLQLDGKKHLQQFCKNQLPFLHPFFR